MNLIYYQEKYHNIYIFLARQIGYKVYLKEKDKNSYYNSERKNNDIVLALLSRKTY